MHAITCDLGVDCACGSPAELVHIPNIAPSYEVIDRNGRKPAPHGRCCVCMNPTKPGTQQLWEFDASLWDGPHPLGGKWSPVGPKCMKAIRAGRDS